MVNTRYSLQHAHAITGVPCLPNPRFPVLAAHSAPRLPPLLSIPFLSLQVALPWLSSGFVGYLGPGEVLALWDRVIGYDSLLVLPLLAAAVLIFR